MKLKGLSVEKWDTEFIGIATGPGIYTFGTDTIISIAESFADMYVHTVFKAGQFEKICPIQGHILDPLVSAMWAACGCFPSQEMLHKGDMLAAFLKEKPGIDPETFIRPKIKWQKNSSFTMDCLGGHKKCELYCDLNEVISSANKRQVTVGQVFRDSTAKCKYCIRQGF